MFTAEKRKLANLTVFSGRTSCAATEFKCLILLNGSPLATINFSTLTEKLFKQRHRVGPMQRLSARFQHEISAISPAHTCQTRSVMRVSKDAGAVHARKKARQGG